MKREHALLALAGLGALLVVFYPDNPSADGPLSLPEVRANALFLCKLYMPSPGGAVRGDAHYLEMTKGYGNVGTTCGYLPAWMLFRLGCRDGRLVNRTEPVQDTSKAPGQTLVYKNSMNIAEVVNGGQVVGAWRWMRAGVLPPEPGDILYFQDVLFIRGESQKPREHVAVFVRVDPDGSLVTYDLGHGIQPEGSLTKRTMDSQGNVQFLGSTRRIVGYDSLADIPFTAEPDLTDHTIAVA